MALRRVHRTGDCAMKAEAWANANRRRRTVLAMILDDAEFEVMYLENEEM